MPMLASTESERLQRVSGLGEVRKDGSYLGETELKDG